MLIIKIIALCEGRTHDCHIIYDYDLLYTALRIQLIQSDRNFKIILHN